jgi:hypothetical protein
MERLSIYNKLFILLCAVLIGIIIWKVPHEKQEQNPAHETIQSLR